MRDTHLLTARATHLLTARATHLLSARVSMLRQEGGCWGYVCNKYHFHHQSMYSDGGDIE